MIINRFSVLFVLFFVSLAGLDTFVSASTIPNPLDYLLSDSRMLFRGEVVEISENLKKKFKAGDKNHTYRYRKAYIEISEVLKHDITATPLKVGDRVEIEIKPKDRLFDKMFRKKTTSSVHIKSINKGDTAIWLIMSSGDNYFKRWDISETSAIKDALVKLEKRYQEALKKDIPLRAKIKKEILAMPAITQAEVNAVMGKGIPEEIDLSTIYVVHYGTMQSFFINRSGKVLGGVPYYSSWRTFKNGRLKVFTKVNGVYGGERFIDRNGKFISKQDSAAMNPDRSSSNLQGPGSQFAGLEKFHIYNGQQQIDLFGFKDKNGKVVFPPTALHVHYISEGMAGVEMSTWHKRSDFRPTTKFSESASKHMLWRRWGFINTEGKMAVEPIFDSVWGFENGLSRVNIRNWRNPRNNSFVGLIDKTGKIVLVICNPFLEEDMISKAIVKFNEINGLDSHKNFDITVHQNNDGWNIHFDDKKMRPGNHAMVIVNKNSGEIKYLASE